jgi:hypothetical protein
MEQARQISLFITLIIWATLIGGIMYSNIVYFPPYLSHLPESNSLITGPYGLQDGNFWMLVHPVAILSTIVTLILNWKLTLRRKFILITIGIYAFALIATAIYFVPGLIAFADSNNSTTITRSEWFQRGQTWQHLSWIRGFFMYAGFFSLLVALTKNRNEPAKTK